MFLDKWQIWHTYSTFFIDPIPDLAAAAQDIVRLGLVECAVVSDGDFYWKSDSAMESGYAKVALSPNRMQAVVTIKPQPEGFVLEAVFQAAHLRFSEMQQFGESGNFPPPYVRGFVGECRLVSPKREILVYPIIKLYATGVVLVEMRIMSPDHAVALEEFVENYVNLYKWRFAEVWGPPGLAVLAQHAFVFYQRHHWPIHLRGSLLHLDRQLAGYLQDQTKAFVSGDFTYELAPLWRASSESEGTETKEDSKGGEADEAFSFSELAHAITAATGTAISRLRRGAHLLLRGQRHPLTLGNYWLARPHIHITRHNGQMETAEENEKQFGDSYGWIMGRLVREDLGLGRRYLPNDLRPFGDFAAYIALQGSLWVWSQSGLRQSEVWALPNDSHLIYENQPKAELLDYGYMLHRRVAATVAQLGTSADVLRTHQDLIELKLHMSEASVFGETRELLAKGWEEMGVPRIQELVTESLATRHAQETAAEQERAVRWDATLTVVFGILAIPTLAAELVEPTWEWLHLRQPSDSNAAKLFFNGVAFLLVVAVLLLYRRMLLHRGRRRA